MLTNPDDLRLLVPAAAASLLLITLVVILVRRRRSERSYVARLLDREERLKLALWATGERYWDYDVASGKLHRMSTDTQTRNHTVDMIEDVADGASLVHPDDLPMARQRLDAYLAGQTGNFLAELRITDGQGDWIWVRARGRAVARDAAGRIVHIAGTALNITGTRAAERELRISSEVLRSMNEAVAVIDRNFDFVSVNPAFLRMTGYDESDVVGRNANLLDSLQHDAAFYQHIRDQIRKRGRWNGEIWQRRKDGEEFLCQIESSTVYDKNGELILYVTVLNDITQQKRAEQELRYLANFDTLTNLPNRSLLSERLSRAIVRAHREDNRIAVLFLDLDRFKDVNDSLGHAAGDRILRAAAARLQQTVGMHHTVARLGGDEFTVVLEGLQAADDASVAAQRVIESFSQPLVLDEHHEITVSPSIGISLFPDHAQVPTELLKHADTAMYQAKAAGRRTWQVYSARMDEATRRRATLAGLLRRVVERDELTLVYQPRYSLHHDRVVGAEALLRWRNPEFGAIPPDQFIPLAEDTGLILEIGEWVLREACTTLRAWHQAGLDGIVMSVNVSPVQLLRGDLATTLARILAETGVASGQLELELTESAIMANVGRSASVLHACRILGVGVAVDDFGTGYSSLAYLKRLPLTTLKIDREFVGDLTRDPDDEAITSTVIAMGHSLELNVVAEGVETAGQLQFLREHGCDEVQGHYVAAAMDRDQCLAFIASGAGVPDPTPA